MARVRCDLKKAPCSRFWQGIVCLALLGVFAALETWTDMDMVVQRFFYDATTHAWLISAERHEQWRLWLYTGPKSVLVGLGVVCLLAFVASFTQWGWRSLRRSCLILFLALALVPLLIASSKQVTNIYCPNQIEDFGGARAYQRLLKPARAENATAPRGKGFPAGHASGGFALMALSFVGCTTRQRRMGMTVGLVVGWAMGVYQMLRGEHFLSHTLTSMVLAWLIILIVVTLAEHTERCPVQT